jgi:hypothetical protein
MVERWEEKIPIQREPFKLHIIWNTKGQAYEGEMNNEKSEAPMGPKH